MQRIIVPVDFSETSATALRFATHLAETMEMDLTVLHVFDANFSLAQAVSTGAMIAEKERLEGMLNTFAQRQVQPILATFQGKMDSLPVVRTEVREGFPVPTIRWVSSEEDCALIVMGGVGAGQADQPPKLFGNVALSTATGSACPVLLIPPGGAYPVIKRMAVAYQEINDIRYLSGITQLIILALHPELVFVHVDAEKAKPTPEGRDLPDALEGSELSNFSFSHASLRGDSVVERLLDFVGKKQIDLLVLGGKRRKFRDRLFHKSNLKPILGNTNIPLLVVPITEE